MLQSAQQQLALVKTHRAEAAALVREQLQQLHHTRTQRTRAHAHLAALRSALAEAEAETGRLDAAHGELETALTASTTDYATAQLLEKRLENCVAGLLGFQFAAVWLRVPSSCASSTATTTTTPPSTADTVPCFVVTDPYTVVDQQQQRSFLVNAAVRVAERPGDAGPSGGPQSQLLDDVTRAMLDGHTQTLLTSGPRGAGKTTLLYGAHRVSTSSNPPASAHCPHHNHHAAPTSFYEEGDGEHSPGVVEEVVARLFVQMHTRGFAHFALLVSFVEVHSDATGGGGSGVSAAAALEDLLGSPGHEAEPGTQQVAVLDLPVASPPPPSGSRSSSYTHPASSLSVQEGTTVTAVTIASLADLDAVLGHGWRRRGRRAGPTHTLLTLHLHTIDGRGDLRQSWLRVLDLQGAQPPHALAGPHAAWVRATHAYLHACVESAVASSYSRSSSSCPAGEALVRLPAAPPALRTYATLLHPLFTGACMGTLLTCVVDVAAESDTVEWVEETRHALTDAFYFRHHVRHASVPCVLPAELQQLRAQTRSLVSATSRASSMAAGQQ